MGLSHLISINHLDAKNCRIVSHVIQRGFNTVAYAYRQIKCVYLAAHDFAVGFCSCIPSLHYFFVPMEVESTKPVNISISTLFLTVSFVSILLFLILSHKFSLIKSLHFLTNHQNPINIRFN